MADDAVLKIQIEEDSSAPSGSAARDFQRTSPGGPDSLLGSPRTEAERTTRLPRTTVKDFDPEDAARKQMQREAERRATEEARKRLDPDYAAKVKAEEDATRQREAQRQADAQRKQLEAQQREAQQAERAQQEARAAQGKQVNQAMRMGGQAEAGGMAEGAIGGAGPAGLAIAGAMLIKQKIDEEVEKFHQRNEAMSRGSAQFGVSAMSGDFRGVGRQVADATSALPLFGREVSAATHAILDLEQAAESLGKRFGQYSYAVANEQVQLEFRRMIREMGRAQRFEEQTVELLRARGSFEDNLSRLTDRFVPVVMNFMSNVLNLLSNMIASADEKLITFLKFLRDVETAIRKTWPETQELLAGIDRTLRDMLAETPTFGPDLFVQQLFNSMGDVLRNRDTTTIGTYLQPRNPMTQPSRAPVGV